MGTEQDEFGEGGKPASASRQLHRAPGETISEVRTTPGRSARAEGGRPAETTASAVETGEGKGVLEVFLATVVPPRLCHLSHRPRAALLVPYRPPPPSQRTCCPPYTSFYREMLRQRDLRVARCHTPIRPPIRVLVSIAWAPSNSIRSGSHSEKSRERCDEVDEGRAAAEEAGATRRSVLSLREIVASCSVLHALSKRH